MTEAGNKTTYFWAFRIKLGLKHLLSKAFVHGDNVCRSGLKSHILTFYLQYDTKCTD